MRIGARGRRSNFLSLEASQYDLQHRYNRRLKHFIFTFRLGHHSTNSGHGTMVDFTVFIAIASATAWVTPSSVNG
jgi:hypothetical protein